MEILNDMVLYLPAIIIALAGLIVMMVDAYTKNTATIYTVSVGSLVLALAAAVYGLFLPSAEIFYGMATTGGTAAFGTALVVAATLFVVVLSREYLTGINHNFAEVYTLILFGTVGMIVLATASDLVTVFLGLETMSIALYVLAGIVRDEKTGIEAALKYFLLGSFATGFFLYGIALLYGATGTTRLAEIGLYADAGLIYWAGVGLLLVGFFFKVSVVPFHMWTPDVYEGAPTTITAYMATAAKTAAFVSLILILERAIPLAVEQWSSVLVVIAILTMVLGNTVAMVQNNVKRMLAYSSIAHAGYVLVGLAAGTAAGYSAVLYYLLAYTLMNIGAFGVVAYYERHKGMKFNSVDQYAGLGYKQPMMAVLLGIFLFSLAGIPPFAGFIGKYQVFAAAIQADLIGLAIVGVLASVAGVYYYLRVLVFLYMKEGTEEIELTRAGVPYRFVLLLLALLTIYFGILPGGLSELLTGFYQGSLYSVAPLP
ncbi:MAG: NADH-quinone oxidoreductase subunit N [Rhodothermaceae bacterium]|nr:NADH-quinone oxidoreductase subunit N [Rhodothermaceae bacterium]